MQQPVQQHSRPSSVADLIADSSLCLPGATLTHVFHVVSTIDRDAAARVLAYLAEQDANARDLSHTRCRRLITQTIVLDGIGERSARALREQMLALDGVLRVRLEHHLVRDTRAATAAAERPAGTAITTF